MSTRLILEAIGWGLVLAFALPVAFFFFALLAIAVIAEFLTTQIQQTWTKMWKQD